MTRGIWIEPGAHELFKCLRCNHSVRQSRQWKLEETMGYGPASSRCRQNCRCHRLIRVPVPYITPPGPPIPGPYVYPHVQYRNTEVEYRITPTQITAKTSLFRDLELSVTVNRNHRPQIPDFDHVDWNEYPYEDPYLSIWDGHGAGPIPLMGPPPPRGVQFTGTPSQFQQYYGDQNEMPGVHFSSDESEYDGYPPRTRRPNRGGMGTRYH